MQADHHPEGEAAWLLDALGRHLRGPALLRVGPANLADRPDDRGRPAEAARHRAGGLRQPRPGAQAGVAHHALEHGGTGGEIRPPRGSEDERDVRRDARPRRGEQLFMGLANGESSKRATLPAARRFSRALCHRSATGCASWRRHGKAGATGICGAWSSPRWRRRRNRRDRSTGGLSSSLGNMTRATRTRSRALLARRRRVISPGCPPRRVSSRPGR